MGLARGSGRPEPFFDENRFQKGRFVRHQPIHAEIDQAAHFGFVVDGPDMDLQACFMGPVDQRPVHQPDALLLDRNLGTPLAESPEKSSRWSHPA